jgi:hypothetical protein
MHDHRLDGMLQFDHQGVTASALRLHLDNSHDAQTRGWDYGAQVRRHHEMHAAEAERLAGIEVAGNLLAEKLAEAPAAVVESVLEDDDNPGPLYLTGDDGTLYLAEYVCHRSGERPTTTGRFLGARLRDAIPLYRLTPQQPEEPTPRVVDLMVALEASLAAVRATLGEAPDA